MKTKNLLLILLAFGFGISVVIFSAFRVSQSASAQQENEEVKEINLVGSSQPLVEATQSAEKKEEQNQVKEEKADYYLPYPGILPDHPLYWLKMLRDKIMLALTKNTQDRFERFLLFADKRIGAAEVLIKGGKAELGITTATKAEKYLEQAIGEFEKLAQNGQATPEIKSKIRKASQKHLEILTALLEKVEAGSKGSMEQARDKTRLNLERIQGQL